MKNVAKQVLDEGVSNESVEARELAENTYPSDNLLNALIEKLKIAGLLDVTGNANALLDMGRVSQADLDDNKAKLNRFMTGNETPEDQQEFLNQQMEMAMNFSTPLAVGAMARKLGPEVLEMLAKKYKTAKGLETLEEPLQKLNPVFSKYVAQEYDALKHAPDNPNVKKAYDNLITEVRDQYDLLKGAGLKTTKMNPNEVPYKNSKQMMADIHENNHLYYYPTEAGFGSDLNNLASNHPMMKSEGGELANDVFRIVHDVFGHAKNKNGFGPVGEEQAYQIHKAMMSPEAQKALATETRGQNSWVNFGPNGEANRANPLGTVYADQKAGLLPDWAVNGIPQTDKETRALLQKIAEMRMAGRPLDRAEQHMMNMKSIRDLIERNYGIKGDSIIPKLGEGITSQAFDAPGLPGKIIKQKSGAIASPYKTVKEQLVFDKLADHNLGPKTDTYLTSIGGYQVQDKVTPLRDAHIKMVDGQKYTDWDRLSNLYGDKLVDTNNTIKSKLGIQPTDSSYHNVYLDKSDNVVKPFDVDQFRFTEKKPSYEDILKLNDTLRKPVKMDISNEVSDNVSDRVWKQAIRSDEPNYINNLIKKIKGE